MVRVSHESDVARHGEPKPLGQPVIDRIEQSSASVMLFSGPRSVGKRTTATYLKSQWGIEDRDYLVVSKLTSSAVSMIKRFMSHAPSGKKKLLVIRMNLSDRMQFPAVLKSIEEPSPQHRVILLATDILPVTIESRAEKYKFRYLSEETVATILTSKHRYSQKNAERLARGSSGQVSLAMQRSSDKDLMPTVLMVLSAIKDGDTARLEKLSRKWTTEHSELLNIWCTEMLTMRWKLFNEDSGEGFTFQQALTILESLKRECRPRIFVGTSLMRLLQEK